MTSTHRLGVVDLDLSRDGTEIVSAGSSSTILLWKDGEARVLARMAVNPTSLRLSSDERAVFVSAGSLASIVDLETGTSRELSFSGATARSMRGAGQYAVVDNRGYLVRARDDLPYEPALLKKWVEDRLLLSGHVVEKP